MNKIQAPNGFIERRSGIDRRKTKMPSIKTLFSSGNRLNTRRAEDRVQFFYLDRYGSTLFIAIIIILIFSMIDALLTLILLSQGAVELNPVMAYFIKKGPMVFIWGKYLLTSVSVIILLLLKDVLSARFKIYENTLFSCLILIFATVILWEVYLMFRFVL